MAEEASAKSESAKKNEDWMNTKWRPAMGWMYMLICVTDFVIFPVLWSLLHTVTHSGNVQQWNPLTLQGAGLFHMAMGAILGIAAYGRTQEKMAGVNTSGIHQPMAPTSQNVTTTYGSPAPAFGGTTSPPPAFGARPSAPAFGSRPLGPTPADQPEL
jgi:Holin of 3TMs, for gene-transfer release